MKSVVKQIIHKYSITDNCSNQTTQRMPLHYKVKP